MSLCMRKTNVYCYRPWRLDPLTSIDGMPDRVFQRMYRVNKQFFQEIHDLLHPYYEPQYVLNNRGYGGRPRIPFSLRLVAFLFYVD